MKSAVYDRYGAADRVRLDEGPVPRMGPDTVLIRTGAASLSTADWRLRASAFPGLLWLPGRLMTGLLAPRNRVLGTSVAGVIEAVGGQVTRFRPGQRVFGFIGHGGHAEYAAVPENAALIETPDTLSDPEAAALPFGAISALVFLRDIARLQPGQHVLIVGASGGVGSYATQIARAMGAQVTAVAGTGRADMLTALGATRTLDYHRQDPASDRAVYDVVLDCVGATSWAQMRRSLKPGGVFVPLNFGGRDLWHLLLSRLSRGPRLALAVSGDTVEDLAEIVRMVEEGALRPVIDRRYPLDRIAEAHARVERRHSAGTVVIDVAPPLAASFDLPHAA